MPLYGVGIDDFGGLDLSDAANEGAGAIDLLNVDFDARGRVTARAGFAKHTTSAAAFTYLTLAPIASGGVILATNGSQIQVINTVTGALGSASSAAATTFGNVVPFGVPGSATVAYAGTGTALGTITKFDGSYTNVTTGLGALTSAYLAGATPVDNRLVLAISGLTGTDSNSTIAFSNPGAPETFVSTNFVELSPNDGEAIYAITNFGNQMFVFKRSKLFVFTGNTIDASGNPIFNYRTVATGVRGVPDYGAVATGPDGVYFLATDGVYKTTGGVPVKVSAAIDPLFGVGGPVPPYFQGVTPFFNYSGRGVSFLFYYEQRLYVSAANSGNTARLVLTFDLDTGEWSYWDLPTNGMCSSPATGNLMFAYSGLSGVTSSNDVGKIRATDTTDAGAAITARYRSDFIGFDYSARTLKRGYNGVEKTIREALVDGIGTVNYRMSKQWVQPANLPAGAALTLGTSPQVAQARDRRAVRGRMFSYQFDGTAPWTVEKLTLNLRDIHEPGLQQSGA